jgi:hypothetical protein
VIDEAQPPWTASSPSGPVVTQLVIHPGPEQQNGLVLNFAISS